MKSKNQVPSLERALVILEYLVKHPRPYILSEIAKELGFPKNSVLRIMNTLQNYGYVNRNEETLAFSLSRKLFSMAYGSPDENNLMENSLDIMRKLRDEIGETVVISVMDENEGLVLEQVQGNHPFRFVCDPGIRQVPHTSASCKAIMAYMPKDRLNEMLNRMDFKPQTSHTITDRKAFVEELEEVRRLGYAVDRGEFHDGVHCIASAIMDRRGIAIAAITITGPSNRLLESSFEKFGSIVAEYTREISVRHGYVLQTSNP